MSDDWYVWNECEVCKSEIIPFDGYEDSKVMILGPAPKEDEVKEGKPMTSLSPMGRVLQVEIRYLRYSLQDFRYGNLWLHPPKPKTDKNFEACFEKSIQEVMKELEGKEAVLLLGAEPVTFFLNENVTDVGGLTMTSHLWSAGVMIPCVSPAMVFKDGSVVGEMRLALQKFIDYCEKGNLI